MYLSTEDTILQIEWNAIERAPLPITCIQYSWGQDWEAPICSICWFVVWILLWWLASNCQHRVNELVKHLQNWLWHNYENLFLDKENIPTAGFLAVILIVLAEYDYLYCQILMCKQNIHIKSCFNLRSYLLFENFKHPSDLFSLYPLHSLPSNS